MRCTTEWPMLHMGFDACYVSKNLSLVMGAQCWSRTFMRSGLNWTVAGVWGTLRTGNHFATDWRPRWIELITASKYHFHINCLQSIILDDILKEPKCDILSRHNLPCSGKLSLGCQDCQGMANRRECVSQIIATGGRLFSRSPSPQNCQLTSFSVTQGL